MWYAHALVVHLCPVLQGENARRPDDARAVVLHVLVEVSSRQLGGVLFRVAWQVVERLNVPRSQLLLEVLQVLPLARKRRIWGS